MNQVKRRSNFPDREKKKLRITFDEKKIFLTSMENLSNELFYEIFDYLDGIDIYNAFLNLNHRFQQLLHSSFLLFKIKLDSPSNELSKNIYKQIILLNKHQIFSVDLSMSIYNNEILSSFNLDSSFIHLESLNFYLIEPDLLISLLLRLTSLPRLFSLTIATRHTLEDINDVYELIFDLPELRFTKFAIIDSEESLPTVSLPFPTNDQLSTIEHLIIDHFCTFDELFDILSYTPQLRRLKFMHLNNSHFDIGTLLPMTLSNLTTVHIDYVSTETLDEFEMFIAKICSGLKALRVTVIAVATIYLNADQWERLILQYLPRLENFYLQYQEFNHNERKSLIFFEEPNRFISLFWIKRQWIFEAEIDDAKITYSVLPYSQRWYDYAQHKIVNYSRQLSKSIRLILANVPPDGCPKSLIMNKSISRVLIVAKIYQLEIFENIFIDRLIGILLLLDELDSLQIYSLSFSQCVSCSMQAEGLSFLSKKNRITKVNLKKMFDIEEIYFLIELCPRMTYLKVNCINNMDMELFVQFILMEIITKSNHPLRLLCFHVPAADDEMIQKLENMIDKEKLLLYYTIERTFDDIYLQWR